MAPGPAKHEHRSMFKAAYVINRIAFELKETSK